MLTSGAQRSHFEGGQAGRIDSSTARQLQATPLFSCSTDEKFRRARCPISFECRRSLAFIASFTTFSPQAKARLCAFATFSPTSWNTACFTNNALGALLRLFQPLAQLLSEISAASLIATESPVKVFLAFARAYSLDAKLQLTFAILHAAAFLTPPHFYHDITMAIRFFFIFAQLRSRMPSLAFSLHEYTPLSGMPRQRHIAASCLLFDMSSLISSFSGIKQPISRTLQSRAPAPGFSAIASRQYFCSPR